MEEVEEEVGVEVEEQMKLMVVVAGEVVNLLKVEEVVVYFLFDCWVLVKSYFFEELFFAIEVDFRFHVNVIFQ